MLKRTTMMFAVCLAALAAAASAGDDWAQWRGDGRDGVDPDAPKLTDALPENPQPVWEIALATDGKAGSHVSPVVADGKAFLHTVIEREEMQKGKKRGVDYDLVICVDLAGGKELWRTKEVRGDNHNTPCVADGKLYYWRPDGKFVCLDTATGDSVWVLDKKKGGTNVSPVVVDDKVIIVKGRDLLAVDAAKGGKIWEVEVDNWNSSPAVWRHDGKDYVIAGNKEISCVAAEDGKVLWTMPGTTSKKRHDPASPVIVGDRMLITWEHFGLHVLKLSTEGAEKVATCEAFVPNTGGAHQAMTPAWDGRFAYVSDKEKTFCWDTETGEVVWEGPKGNAHSSPILADGKLLIPTKRTMLLLDAKTGEVLGETKRGPMDVAGCSSPALAGSMLVVNEGSHLRCYDLGKK